MTTKGFESIFIDEPLLTFGEGKQYIDPKWGLKAYGPCLYNNRHAIASALKIGIIGSKETISLAEQWISRCQGEIAGKKEDSLLFQSFPGFTKLFGCELKVLSECIEVLSGSEIGQIIKIPNFRKRVGSAAKLFIDKLNNLHQREPRPHVVICAIPQTIINTCGRKKMGFFEDEDEVTPQEKEIMEMLEDYRRTDKEPAYLEDNVLDIIPEASDLRRIIKAEAMCLGIPTQLAKPTTFKSSPKEASLQDDATRAWNFCVALYYKAEGYPWKLAHMKEGTCYVGISFYKDPVSPNRVRTSVAQVFTHTGEGLVLKGGRAIIDENNKSPYLSKEAAFKLMNDILQVYKNQMHVLPTRLVVHKSSRYRPEELTAFNEASKDVGLKDFITVLTRGIRFMRQKGALPKYPPLRGTAVKVATDDWVFFTKGWIPFFETYPGLRVPTPIEVVEHHGDSPLKVIFEEILALTKMNWNSADFCIREPITLAYSREVGKILAYVPEEVNARPEYLYYM